MTFCAAIAFFHITKKINMTTETPAKIRDLLQEIADLKKPNMGDIQVINWQIGFIAANAGYKIAESDKAIINNAAKQTSQYIKTRDVVDSYCKDRGLVYEERKDSSWFTIHLPPVVITGIWHIKELAEVAAELFIQGLPGGGIKIWVMVPYS